MSYNGMEPVNVPLSGHIERQVGFTASSITLTAHTYYSPH